MADYTNRTIVPWPLMPNWAGGVQETLSFNTAVYTAVTGVRQKSRQRLAPRRSFSFATQAPAASRRLLDNMLARQGKAEWALPIWHDRQVLSVAAAAGSNVAVVETDGIEFSTHVLVRVPDVRAFSFEVMEIQNVFSDRIAFKTNFTRSWPVGSLVYPLRNARLAEMPTSSLLTSRVSSQSVEFELSEPSDYPAYAFPTTYQGYPVFEIPHDYRGSKSVTFDRMIDSIDNTMGLPLYYDLPGLPFIASSMTWTLRGRAEHNKARSMVYALAGRLRTIWVPSFTDDLNPTARIIGGASEIQVTECGYSVFGRGLAGRQDIRVELYDGSVYYRRITGSSVSGSSEYLIVDSTFPVTIELSNIKQIGFVALSQLASDSVDISHITDANRGYSTLNLAFEGALAQPT